MQESSEESASQNEGDARGEARLTEPTFKAYGSGAPKWLGLLIFLAFFAAAVAALAPQVIHPTPLQGFALFMTVTTDNFMLVLAPDSSRKISRAGSKPPCRRRHARRARAMSGRSCSLARSVFFYMSAQGPPTHNGWPAKSIPTPRQHAALSR